MSLSFLQETNKINKEQKFSKIIYELKNIINSIQLNISKNINSDINIEINKYLIIINKLLNKLESIININVIQNESIIKKDEHTIRCLYGEIFNNKLMNEVLENKIGILHKREKEYELLKQKTGAIVCNGQIICNERKDNEIIILRTENSLLKTVIKNNEELLKEKNDMINSLNSDIVLYKNQIDELLKTRHGKYSSFSNINININEAKKDYNKKNRNKPFINTIQVISTTKKNSSSHSNQNATNKNNDNKNLGNKHCLTSKNSMNNIYTSYQINSQLISKVNKNKNSFIKKDEIFTNHNISKNEIKNETIEPNKTFSIKYISVNKSLFSPKNIQKQKVTLNNNKNNKRLPINRIKKNKCKINNNLSNREYNTLLIDLNDNKNEVKVIKGKDSNKIRHKKSNSIQCREHSIKKLLQGKAREGLFMEKNNSNLYTVIKKINHFQNHTTKNSNSISYSINNFIDGFKNKNNNQKYLNYFLKSYADRRKDRGRNENSKIVNDSFKDNSSSILQKTFINKTSIENSNPDKIILM